MLYGLGTNNTFKNITTLLEPVAFGAPGSMPELKRDFSLVAVHDLGVQKKIYMCDTPADANRLNADADSVSWHQAPTAALINSL